MKKEQLELLNEFINLYDFKVFKDCQGNEFVLYKSDDTSQFAQLVIEDKTAFEAVQNHVHVFDNIRQGDRAQVAECMEKLSRLMIDILSLRFPGKHFVVFSTVSQSAIIRFHQKWGDEPWYYDVKSEYDDAELICFES